MQVAQINILPNQILMNVYLNNTTVLKIIMRNVKTLMVVLLVSARKDFVGSILFNNAWVSVSVHMMFLLQ